MKAEIIQLRNQNDELEVKAAENEYYNGQEAHDLITKLKHDLQRANEDIVTLTDKYSTAHSREYSTHDSDLSGGELLASKLLVVDLMNKVEELKKKNMQLQQGIISYAAHASALEVLLAEATLLNPTSPVPRKSNSSNPNSNSSPFHNIPANPFSTASAAPSSSTGNTFAAAWDNFDSSQ